MSKIARHSFATGLVMGFLLCAWTVSQAAQDPLVATIDRHPTLAHVGEAIFQADELLGASSTVEKSPSVSDQPHQFHGDLFGPEKRLLPQDIFNKQKNSKESPNQQEQ